MDRRGVVKRLSQSEHGFTYRSSVFQQQDLIVLETSLAVSSTEKTTGPKYRGQQGKRRRLPLLPSCGSTFRNPPGTYAGKSLKSWA